MLTLIIIDKNNIKMKNANDQNLFNFVRELRQRVIR